MITITVKTLNGLDHPFEISDELTVREFKDHISETVKIPAERQRLIFQGRVLQDGRKLSEIGLDQKTVHLVERLPVVPGSENADSSPQPEGRHQSARSGRESQQQRGPAGEFLQQQMVMGAMELPSGDLTRDQIAACLRRILNRCGPLGRHAQLDAREAPDGSSVQVDIRLRSDSPSEHDAGSGDGNGRRRIDGPATQRFEHVLHIIHHINHLLYHLENDSDTADRQHSTTEGIPTNPSASAEPCGGCRHDGASEHSTRADQDSVPSIPEGSSRGSTFDAYFHHEVDTLNGEEVEIRQTSIRGLAGLWNEIVRLEERLKPHLARYQQILRDDATYASNDEAESRRASRLFNAVQTILHNLAHVFHTYSDLNVHFCQPPPRFLYPQLVGTRTPPPGQPIITEQSTTTLHTTAEVQITMNFQREPDGDRVETSSPPTDQRSSGSQGAGAAGDESTTGNVAPDSSTTNQGSAPAIAAGNQSQQQAAAPRPPTVSGPTRAPEQQQGTPQNFLQQLLQGIAGAVGGAGFPPNAQQLMGSLLPRGPGLATGGNASRIPQRTFAANAERPPPRFPLPFAHGGPFHRTMMQPQNMTFTAAPYNSTSTNPQVALFVGYDPPSEVPLYTFDEYLPCGSRHFDPRLRPALFSHRPQPCGGTASRSSAGSDGRSPSTAEATGLNEREREFERQLEPIVRSVVNSLQDNSRGIVSGGQRQQGGVCQFIPIFSGTVGGSVVMPAPPGTGHLRPPANDSGPLRRPSSDPNLPRSANEASVPSNTNDGRAVMEGMIRNAFSSMMGHSTETLGSTMRSMGQEIEHSDSVLVEALQIVVLSLSFGDIWALFANDSTPLDRSRTVLRRHLVENLLNGNESPSEADLGSAGARAASLDVNLWLEVTERTPTNEDLDFTATMVHCEEAFITDVLLLIFGYTINPGESFGRRLYDRTWRFLRESVTCAAICCSDGEHGFDEFSNRLVSASMNNVLDEFREPVAASGVQHLRTLYTSHQLQRAEVEHHLIKKSTQSTSDRQPPETSASTGCSSSRMTDNEDDVAGSSSKTVSNETASDEEWKRQLPAEWGRVLEMDVERQRSMAPQRPFSDAYSSGMPPKKRKRSRTLLNAATTSPQSLFKEALREAISVSGATPVTGEQVEDVVDHIVGAESVSGLTTGVRREVERRLGQRLLSERRVKDQTEERNRGKDFDPEKFPNASNKFLDK